LTNNQSQKPKKVEVGREGSKFQRDYYLTKGIQLIKQTKKQSIEKLNKITHKKKIKQTKMILKRVYFRIIFS